MQADTVLPLRNAYRMMHTGFSAGPRGLVWMNWCLAVRNSPGDGPGLARDYITPDGV